MFKTIHTNGTGEIEEKKSRFIAHVAKVTTEEEAVAFITQKKKEFFDARHNCSAFVIGENQELTRCSDDGEPSGTAGRPMLEVLTRERITNVCVVVTRYFGGTLLGTGGLVRAYQGAVKEGLNHCSILKKIQGAFIDVKCDYTDFGKIQFMCSQNDYYIDNTDYSDSVVVRVLVTSERVDDFCKDVNNVTSGKATLSDPENVVYAMIDGKPELF